MAEKQAFDAKRFSGFHLDPNEVKIVGLDVPPEDGLAHLYDPRCHDPVEDSMVRNIMYHGVIEPVIVTKVGEIAYVVDGRGRIKATREANLRLEEQGKEPIRVPAIIRRGQEHDLFGVSVSANELRRDDNPIIKAEKVQRYINMGRDVSEAAVTFGVTEVAVNQWLKLLTLAQPVQKMVKDGKLSSHAASKLDTLPPEKQIEVAKKAVEKAKVSGKKVTGAKLQEQTGGSPATPPKRVIQKIANLKEKPPLKEGRDDFWAGVLFMLGKLTPEDVGLDATIAEIEKAKEMAEAERAERRAKRKEKKKKRELAAAERKAKAEKRAAAKAAAEKAKAEKAEAKAEKAEAEAEKTTGFTIAKKKGASHAAA